MNGVRALGYLGITSDTPSDWRELAGPLLGAQAVERSHGLDIRLDERAWRVHIVRGKSNDLAFAGWEVSDDTQLDALVHDLTELGHTFQEASRSDASHRDVQRMVTGTDPDGNRVELFHSMAVADEPFVSQHQISFETKPGVGHMVLYCADLEAMLDFYCQGLGLRVTDTIHLDDEVIYFLRCNERHHSLALVAGRQQYTLQHIMFEVPDVDAVGSAFERCSAVDLAQTNLGRHSNDGMFSFYAMAPGGYTVEYGCGGRLIDEGAHRGASYTTTSWWGHRDIRPSR